MEIAALLAMIAQGVIGTEQQQVANALAKAEANEASAQAYLTNKFSGAMQGSQQDMNSAVPQFASEARAVYNSDTNEINNAGQDQSQPNWWAKHWMYPGGNY